ncbi:hypothetical protein SISSUDRAFT_979604 [Sistotremastrum suecicum HHB10207 ss-3]|uniref:E3 ubiquitin-protein ligase n=1 Tax=Sistotremastrum suecicum HHB10207 ss-3 TaxID=1314776 RepID=A0A166HKK7_9AGAM|nr:hypothetical protein SISSUDRAFT_979604 [Sistotremastrum suecicum HHB10207 ss-3]
MSFLFQKLNTRDRPGDGLSRLRFTLETIPTSRKQNFTAATRAEILSELYSAFWGQHSYLFLPNANASSLSPNTLLSEAQKKFGFGGNGRDEDPPVPGRSCGRIFQKGESCYRCKDCSLDDSCVMCSRCFHATDHTGHNVSFYLSQQPGGCCDCGDSEAWRHPVGCPYHPPADPNVQPRASTRTLENWTPKVYNPHRAAIPHELRDSMSRTIAYALDFLLDTLDYSPDEANTPRTEKEVRLQPSADPLMADMYAVLLWNDEKHSFDEVIHIVMDATGCDYETASALANSIDEQGRDVVEMDKNVGRLLQIAQLIAQIDLGVTIRRVHDYFREQIAAVVIEWIVDLTQSRVGSDYITIRELISSELLAPRKKDSSSLTTNQEATKVYSEVRDPARLDWMFLYHTRLWKKPRLSLKQVYVSVLTLSHEHKLAVAVHFANVYHRIIDSYLLIDREAETSIKYFALQLFTVPSIAQHIVRQHNIISRLLAIITAFFTDQIVNKRVTYPPVPGLEVDVDKFPFKSKRFMPVFSDLRYICSNESVQQLIADNHDYIANFVKVCQLFMGINPNKRAAANHVEYETEAWINVFNVTLSLSRVVKVYGEAYSRASAKNLITTILMVISEIFAVCTLEVDRLDKSKYPEIHFHRVTFNGTSHDVIQFDVMDGWVSFHHALHWLLAELFKHTHLLTREILDPLIGNLTLHEVIMQNTVREAMLVSIEFPMRILTVIAQIRTGLWVRNGFAIRGQLLHYRDFMLRELCYDQDLFLVQTAFALLGPSRVLVSLLDRFQLTDWFSGIMEHQYYDSVQSASMVEEFFYVLITCLSEDGNAKRLSVPEVIRREIIHALAVGACTFTDLLKRIAERMVDDVCFERVLSEVAAFKPPEGTSDSGLYELKDERFDDVDPFFYHYTRNKREEVDGLLRERLKKQSGDSDPVIVPKPLNVLDGPFVTLPDAFLTSDLMQIIFYAIHNVVNLTDSSGTTPASTEAIADQAMHLIMLGLVEHGEGFSKLACEAIYHDGMTLLTLLCSLEHHAKFKTFKPRVNWILGEISKHQSAAVQASRHVTDDSKSRAAKAEDAKKRAAKARQNAIMKNFAAAQATFLENLSDDESDEMVAEEEPSRISYGSCIVCQEELDGVKSFGQLGFLQPSKLLRRLPDDSFEHLAEVLNAPESLDVTDPPKHSGTFPPPADETWDHRPNFGGFSPDYTRIGIHASVCGHMMHLDCFSGYSMSIRHRHRAQAQRNPPESFARKEYICPLCKSLGNVIIPVMPATTQSPMQQPFAEWIRQTGIHLLRSNPDKFMESLQYKNGSGEFVFWAAQDSGYQYYPRSPDEADPGDHHKMADTVMVIAKSMSLQTAHLRERVEPEPPERGAGAYLPDDLLTYTISAIEVSQRGSNTQEYSVLDGLSENSFRMIRGLLCCLSKVASIPFKDRIDEGRTAIRQSILKRLLPEWQRENAYQHPLLSRDPFAILVETAVVDPTLLRYVVVLTYYAELARVVVGLVGQLSDRHPDRALPNTPPKYQHILGDVTSFFLAVVRHNIDLERATNKIIQAYGAGRLEKLMYTLTLPFLRRAVILIRAVCPSALRSPISPNASEYERLLDVLSIPPPSQITSYEPLQTALGGWSAHYCMFLSVVDAFLPLEYPCVYRLASLPLILDSLFGPDDQALFCKRCQTSPSDSAICLICGTIVCLQSHCCQENDGRERGECNMHTRECGGVIGLYFAVKRCATVYLYANNGSFAQAPYLDVHGEVDLGMRRGRRQFLHAARYEEISKTWLSHGIPTLVARKLESTVDSGGWETL